MRPRALKHTFLAITQIIAITVCLSAPSLAQAPTPSPSPATPTSGTDLKAFSDNLKKIAERAIELVPAIESGFEGPILPWLERISLTLALIIMMAAFAKMWKENAGAGAELFFWFVRLGVIFALLGSGPKIINGMAEIGKRIAGNQNNLTSLYLMYETHRNNFDNNYKMFTDGVFTVRDKNVPVDTGGVLGVLSSNETSLQGPIRKFETISRSMPLLLDTMNIARGVISFGDLFLTLLGSFLMIIMRLAAPVMIALAINRGIAQQATYPYLWGVVVLTLVWPVLTLFIKTVAYLGGNIGLTMNDKQQIYSLGPDTMEIIKSGDQQPVYTIFFAAAVMLIAGIALWMTPYFAYQLSSGKLYEGFSMATSSLGNIIQYYGVSRLAGSFSQRGFASGAAGGANVQLLNGGPLNDSTGRFLRFTAPMGGPTRQYRSIQNPAAGNIGALNAQTGQMSLNEMGRNFARDAEQRPGLRP